MERNESELYTVQYSTESRVNRRAEERVDWIGFECTMEKSFLDEKATRLWFNGSST